MIKIRPADKVGCEIFGEVVELTKPTLGELDVLQATEDKDAVGRMVEMLVQMGMTAEMAKKLTVDQASHLLTDLAGVKKS